MEVRLNPVEFAKSMMKKKKQLIPIPIVLDNGIAGIVYGYYEGEDFYYLDRLDGAKVVIIFDFPKLFV